MRAGKLIILILVGISFPGTARDGGPGIRDFLACYNVADHRPEESFKNFLTNIGKARSHNDRVFLQHLFGRIHKSYLKHYKASVGFPALFTRGDFDCLSGTALLGIALDHFDFNYSIIETNYHVFILVHLSHGDVLLESTDQENGIVFAQRDIEQRIERYKENLLTGRVKNGYRYHINLYQEIRPDQLKGLVYFNLAIASFNEGDWDSCADLMERSAKIYSSPRMEELARLLIQRVSCQETDMARAQKIISRILRLETAAVAGI